MRILIIVFILLPFVSFSQMVNYNPKDSTLRFYDNTGSANAAALKRIRPLFRGETLSLNYVDTIYRRNDTVFWKRNGTTYNYKDSVGGGSSVGVDTIYRTPGKDSIQFTIGGRYRAIKDSSGGGGSTSPAGNYGNVQLNRNTAFATPASDSLDYENSTGLQVKNKIHWGTSTTYIFGSSSTAIDIGYSGVKRAVFDLSNNAIRVAKDGKFTISNTNGNPESTTLLAMVADSVDRLGITNESTYRDVKLRDLIFTGRNQLSLGANVASAGDLTLGAGGNLFHITGTTTINAITVSNWRPGSEITLIFDASLTFKNNTAGGAGTAKMLLAGGVDFSATANDVVKLIYDGVTWFEVSRSVN